MGIKLVLHLFEMDTALKFSKVLNKYSSASPATLVICFKIDQIFEICAKKMIKSNIFEVTFVFIQKNYSWLN